MTKRQKEELAKLYLDIGKLTLASFVFGFFQINLDPVSIFIIAVCGLTTAIIFFRMGLKLFKEIK